MKQILGKKVVEKAELQPAEYVRSILCSTNLTQWMRYYPKYLGALKNTGQVWTYPAFALMQKLVGVGLPCAVFGIFKKGTNCNHGDICFDCHISVDEWKRTT